MAVLPVNGYDAEQTQSPLAIRMLKWLEHTKNITIQHKLNGGEHIIDTGTARYRVDGYDHANEKLYEIHGCFWHGCTKCNNSAEIMPIIEKTFGSVSGVFYT